MKVWLRSDPHDGNDPEETYADLAFVPRVGDQIETWRTDAGQLQRSRAGALRYSGSERWLTVESVVLHTDGDTVEVWVRLDGYVDGDELRGTFAALKRGDDPGKVWDGPVRPDKPDLREAYRDLLCAHPDAQSRALAAYLRSEDTGSRSIDVAMTVIASSPKEHSA